MAILTLLVIATIIITGVYVGYHAYEASLHEEVKAHSFPNREKIDRLQLSEFQSYLNPNSPTDLL